MPSLEAALGSIPGYGGYAARQQMNEEGTLNDVRALTGALGIRGAMQEQAAKQRAVSQDQAFRAELAALGPNPDQNALATIAAKYAPAGDVLKSQTASLDRQDSIAAQRAAREGQLLLQLQNAGMMHEFRTANAKTTEERNAEIERHNRETERLTGLIASIRGQNAGASKPPPGYRATQDGNLEAIPGGPADIKAQADAQRKATGAEDVDVALGTLRGAYDRLEKGGGITSTDNSALGNMAASASSSGIGQALGRTFGTENQSARNDVAMARPALLAALMKATGMSSRQMDSNAELKLWLSTATDPTLDVGANRRALDNIERKYLSARSGPRTEPGAPTPSDAGGNPREVKLPNGRVMTFPTPAAASEFRRQAGL